MTKLAALLIVVAGAVAAFAIYTFGWHERSTKPSLRAQIARQDRLLLALEARTTKIEATTRKHALYLRDECSGYRSLRDPSYVQGVDRDVRYFILVLRTSATTCDQDGIR